MKNSLAFIVLLTSATMGFAQGKLAFMNNSDQLIYFGVVLPADAKVAGSGLCTGAGGTITALAGSPTIIAGLWGGTSASSLTKRTTTTFGDVDFSGFLNQANCTFADLPAGTPAFFQIQVYDSRDADALSSWQRAHYAGLSGVFEATPTAATYSPIYQKSSPVNSTLPSGTQLVRDYAGFPGYFGLIEVSAFPEPNTLALAALGAAALMIARRRR